MADGVCWDEGKQRWVARATVAPCRRVTIGRYVDREDAVRAREVWLQTYMPAAREAK